MEYFLLGIACRTSILFCMQALAAHRLSLTEQQHCRCQEDSRVRVTSVPKFRHLLHSYAAFIRCLEGIPAASCSQIGSFPRFLQSPRAIFLPLPCPTLSHFSHTFSVHRGTVSSLEEGALRLYGKDFTRGNPPKPACRSATDLQFSGGRTPSHRGILILTTLTGA